MKVHIELRDRGKFMKGVQDAPDLAIIVILVGCHQHHLC